MAFANPTPAVANAIYNAAAKYGIDPSWLFGIGNQESGLNANAPQGGAGEIGTFQVLPSTGASLGYSSSDLSTLQGNADAAAAYLAQLAHTFNGDPNKVFAAYNEGPGQVQAGNIFSTTAQYVSNVISAVQHYAQVEPPAQANGQGTAPTVDALGNIQFQNPDGTTTFISQDGTTYTTGGGPTKPSTVTNTTQDAVQTLSQPTENWLSALVGGIEANIFLSGVALAFLAGGFALIASDSKVQTIIKTAAKDAAVE